MVSAEQSDDAMPRVFKNSALIQSACEHVKVPTLYKCNRF
jgi:hypothetical protein